MPTAAEARRRIVIPDGVTVDVSEGNHVIVKGEKGTIERSYPHPRVAISKDAKGIVVLCTLPRRKEKALTGTLAAQVGNMVKGVSTGFEYRMKTVFSHFPIKTAVKDGFFEVQNFLGERSPRRARILEGVKVVVKGEMVTLTGIDLENVSQTAANIEQATRVRRRDTRVFQDGVYVVSKEA